MGHDSAPSRTRSSHRLRRHLCAVVVVALGIGLLGPAASADKGNHAFPSQAQVDAAKKKAEQKRQDVASIKAELLMAQGRLQTAQQNAEIASENYNGAMWHLALARQQLRQARKDAATARANVSAQRDAIGALVVESYQQGGDLSAVTALLSADGPESVMNSYAAFQGASTSLQADYQRFTASSALAKVFEAKAVRAQARQQRLAQTARKMRASAMAAADAASAIKNQIAAQQAQLIQELAKAQHISVSLATQRQHALAEIARKRAEAAARARAKAAAAAAARARAQQQQSGDGSGTPAPPSGGPTPPTDPNPPPVKGGAAKAISYAKAQLGKPYEWGGSGPDSFDCSGLTMRAWQAGGLSLVHYAEAQYYQGTPITVSDAKPGDLIFFSYNGSPSGIHHVALYLGNGDFIEAPHTGADVRYNSIYNWYPDFAVRL